MFRYFPSTYVLVLRITFPKEVEELEMETLTNVESILEAVTSETLPLDAVVLKLEKISLALGNQDLTTIIEELKRIQLLGLWELTRKTLTKNTLLSFVAVMKDVVGKSGKVTATDIEKVPNENSPGQNVSKQTPAKRRNPTPTQPKSKEPNIQWNAAENILVRIVACYSAGSKDAMEHLRFLISKPGFTRNKVYDKLKKTRMKCTEANIQIRMPWVDKMEWCLNGVTNVEFPKDIYDKIKELLEEDALKYLEQSLMPEINDSLDMCFNKWVLNKCAELFIDL